MVERVREGAPADGVRSRVRTGIESGRNRVVDNSDKRP